MRISTRFTIAVHIGFTQHHTLNIVKDFFNCYLKNERKHMK